MTIGRDNKIFQLLDSKMRIILCDNRTFIGTFAAYDKRMNVVLTDCTEYKKYKPKRRPAVEGKKVIGTAIIRGENIMSIIIDEEPPSSSSSSSSRYEGHGSSRYSSSSSRR